MYNSDNNNMKENELELSWPADGPSVDINETYIDTKGDKFNKKIKEWLKGGYILVWQ